ncbi:MAG: hypothetical protein H0W40_13400 [Methylibium sp.]|uniref:hypothetical protein n=1 Tax=Methylibium sp. TaxID=2067992 RepID=UPI001809CE1B|nr:hypothetical protein [Methylibium sp.]MBA2722286.1 hypothetical protein [Methylibium sp.]MBA3598351.1 hypothetical protein [Methylibium sp.]
MKKADLEKTKAMKIVGKLAQSGTPVRYGAAPAPAIDRREQRRLDQAAGLVPFATKLPADLITALHFAAHTRGVTTGELLVQLLSGSLPGYHAGTDSQEG